MTAEKIKETVYARYSLHRPTFLTGVASIFDFAGNLHSQTLDKNIESGAEADARALYSDWLTVGDDLRAALHQYGKRV